ncbi:MAG: HD domain-containing protein [Kofleriaceae bacterium]
MDTPHPDLPRILEFILEIDRLKHVARKIRLRGSERYENAAEHSWQIALLAISLAPHAAAPVDLARVVAMLLVHDLGEIDTGDTMFFVEGGWEERKAAERAAVSRITGLLPDDRATALFALWAEFDEEVTAEARFANAVDRAMPVILNLANGGQSWRDNGISYERVASRVAPQIRAGCPSLWAYLSAELARARDAGWFGA